MLIILQGRFSSSRLPAKAFLPFFNQTILERICDIALSINIGERNRVVFATGDLEHNLIFRDVVESKGIEFFVGPEDNVFERFKLISKQSKQEYVARITCDNYLIQPEIVEALAIDTQKAKLDYGFVSPLSHFSAEIIRREILVSNANLEVNANVEEHVTWAIRNSKKIRKMKKKDDFLGVNHANTITLDTLDDFLKLKHIEKNYPDISPIRSLGALRIVSNELL